MLLYDREYRQLQANLGFKWGTDFPACRDVMLVPREKKGGNTQSKGKKFDQRGPNRQGTRDFRQSSGGNKPRRPGNNDGRRFQICKDFNFRECWRKPCFMVHMCASCKSRDHGELNCKAKEARESSGTN